jgi:ferredoxin
MSEIVIDGYRCSGCGTCVEICPDVFQLDSLAEKAELVTVTPAVTDLVYQAAAFCPEKCIAVRD